MGIDLAERDVAVSGCACGFQTAYPIYLKLFVSSPTDSARNGGRIAS